MTASSVNEMFRDNLDMPNLSPKIFLVGAAEMDGLACEILRNFSLTGFKDIETIEYNSIALDIQTYNGNISSAKYGVNFFKRYSLVMNALDNKAARYHVNRLCLAADVPLIEVAIAGHAGQVKLIKRGVSECYECLPKDSAKTFPGCTIRNTPSEPIHCIVWATNLFNQLFGESVEDEEVSPDSADPEAAGENALDDEVTQKGNINRVSTRQWAENCDYNIQDLFTKFFHDDIVHLRSMQNLWKERTPPIPLDFTTNDSTDLTDTVSRYQRALTLPECCELFKTSVENLSAILPDKKILFCDKDNRLVMDFVTACANIRSYSFGIEQKTGFEVMYMAGNIIPAISTTNVIVAGVAVMHAFRVLQEQFEEYASASVRPIEKPQKQILVPEKNLNEPNPTCHAGSQNPKVKILLDVNKMTIYNLEKNVLKKCLNMIAPDVIYEARQIVVISSEEGETDINSHKTLSDLGIVDGSILQVDDFLQKYKFEMTISQWEPPSEELPFMVISPPGTLKINESNSFGSPSTSADSCSAMEQDDDLILNHSEEEISTNKRKRYQEEMEQNNSKMHKSRVSREIIEIIDGSDDYVGDYDEDDEDDDDYDEDDDGYDEDDDDSDHA